MRGFDTFVVIDWSARATPSPAKPSADAIWMAVASGGDVECHYFRTRAEACQGLITLFEQEIDAGRRVLAGFDFPFAYPKGFAQTLTGSCDPLAVWAWLAERITDAPDNANNRFEIARNINRLFPGVGPFWGCPAHVSCKDLPDKGRARHDFGLAERRGVEALLPNTQPVWKLFTTGSVGSQALLGIAQMQALRVHFGAQMAVAPFEAPDTPVVICELFPSLLAPEIAQLQELDEIKDRAQVRVFAQTLTRVDPADLDRMLRAGDPEEGWILGAENADTLRGLALQSAALTPPPLRNDCFALPAGIDWVPVDQAHAYLKQALSCVTTTETITTHKAGGLILAEDVIAKRANPPHPNTAVDGYGFAGGRPEGVHHLPLVSARATAGSVQDAVPAGAAIRILTGAALPAGVDTVVLQEDVSASAREIAFHGPIKPGANTRKAGEDVHVGQAILAQGMRLRAPDLALATAAGVAQVLVRKPLRVGVLSTGDELIEIGASASMGKIYDANRPMLLQLLAQWGVTPVDLGKVEDSRDRLRAALDGASTDAILTSGGASAGDEDHVSALLHEAGALQMWRIAVKPGRPLALGLWGQTPVFGLPGNPVAAMVCALMFARPALGVLAGEGWCAPAGYRVPAAFEKRKKPGRREYLRARMQDGQVEVFASEGSGRISGLSWADGLVELPDGDAHVRPGDLVKYYPFSGF
ncbi:MAG: molybdopterin-binding protein [Paracoccaceae bacterium]